MKFIIIGLVLQLLGIAFTFLGFSKEDSEQQKLYMTSLRDTEKFNTYQLEQAAQRIKDVETACRNNGHNYLAEMVISRDLGLANERLKKQIKELKRKPAKSEVRSSKWSQR